VNDWLARNGARIYLAANVVVLLTLVTASAVQNVAAGPVLYVGLLFAVCSLPLTWLKRVNDRYSLLAMFMGNYFILFGALGLQSIITGADPTMAQDGYVTAGRIAVLIGAALAVAGYLFGARAVGESRRAIVPTDWSNSAVMVVGLACWILGSAAMGYYALYVVPENTLRATVQGFASMGPFLTFAVMLGHLLQPLGLVILAYGYAKIRTPTWLLLIVAVVLTQVALGFVTDTKGTALFGFLLVALTKTLWEGKLPKGWIALIIVFATLMFPVFQAYRVEVRGGLGLNRQQALENIEKVLEVSFGSTDKVYEGRQGDRAQTFLERSSGEASLELLFEHAGVDTPLLHGRTLIALPLAFVPRLILPDKEDVQVGQLYNRTFLHGASDDFTYISVSQLGEFYWNFGWPGVVIGMFLTGVLLGVIGANSSLADVQSLSRLLILLVTVKNLVLGFGGSISISYIVWLRALAAIGLLHLVYSRPAGKAAAQAALQPQRPLPATRPPASQPTPYPTPHPATPLPADLPPQPQLCFPNLMR
jgi:hypothetical protein